MKYICPDASCPLNAPGKAGDREAIANHVTHVHASVSLPIGLVGTTGLEWECAECHSRRRATGWDELERLADEHMEEAHPPQSVSPGPEIYCGAWPSLEHPNGCVLPKLHNMGNADIPENHQFASVSGVRVMTKREANELFGRLEAGGYEVIPEGSPIEVIHHPAHYGGDTTYEAIKVIEAWELGFCLGNTVKYIARAGRKHADVLEDLKKARWYLDREIGRLEPAAEDDPALLELAWDEGFEAGSEHAGRYAHGSNGPSDPPRNPYEGR